MTKRNKTAAEKWVTVLDMSTEDEAAELRSMSEADLDEELRKAGHDPDAIAAEGAALAAKLGERRERLRWQTEAALAEREFEAHMEEIRRRRVKLPREELKARIKAAKDDARLAEPVTALFRKRTMEESTDEELQVLLEQIEILKSQVLEKKK
jgi:hypothetical protein